MRTIIKFEEFQGGLTPSGNAQTACEVLLKEGFSFELNNSTEEVVIHANHYAKMVGIINRLEFEKLL